jgi:hypothetical protein
VSEGVKFDTDKPTFDLIPFDALGEIHRVFVFGSKKYASRNWEQGMGWMRLANAALRHIFAWIMGQDKDPETGLSHMVHAAFCVLAIVAYELRGTGTDDRAKPVDKGA